MAPASPITNPSRSASTGFLRCLVPPREGAHRAEPADADLGDPRFRAAGEHGIGPPKPDVVERLANRHVGGSARGALGPERATSAELHRDPRSTHVRDDRGDRERVDAVRAALDQLVVAVLESLESADAGRDRRAHAIGLRLDVKARVLLGHARGRDDHLREAVDLPRLAVLDPLRGVEVLELAGEVHGELRRVELQDRRRAALAGGEVLPERLRVVPERSHGSHPGHDDASSSVRAQSFPLFLHPEAAIHEEHISCDERGFV
jgi:hypothetical protein